MSKRRGALGVARKALNLVLNKGHQESGGGDDPDPRPAVLMAFSRLQSDQEALLYFKFLPVIIASIDI
jgi:hypothetical protein